MGNESGCYGTSNPFLPEENLEQSLLYGQVQRDVVILLCSMEFDIYYRCQHGREPLTVALVKRKACAGLSDIFIVMKALLSNDIQLHDPNALCTF